MIQIHNNFLPKDVFKEEWRDVFHYEDNYQVSNLGKIRNKKTGYILKQRQNHRGHLILGLSKNGKVKTVLVSRLVAKAFIPNPLNLPDVDHIIENKEKTNNTVSNLQWITKRDNSNKYFKKTKLSREHTGVKKVGEKFQCAIRIKGKEYYIGTYKTSKEASDIYKEIANDNSLLTKYRKVRKTKGVSFVKRTGKWQAYAHKNGSKIHLGFYKTEDEAIKNRNKYLKTQKYD